MARAALPPRFRAQLNRAQLFPERGTAILAVSGGPDSVALLDLMVGIAADTGLTLVVAHADHGIQAESSTVGQAVARLAEQYGLPFELGELHLGADATETEARRARYAWLADVRRRHAARYLVTAHHQDDQVETVVMRFLRGSAPAGLAGMPARGRGGIVRPLLPFTRAELAAHVAARGLATHDDPANRDPRHLRSWVRVHLLPQLVERMGSRVTSDLVRASGFAARERRAWDHALELVPQSELHVTDDGFDVARDALARYDDALAVALLRAAARRAGLVLGPQRARRLMKLASRASGRRMNLGGEWVAEVAFDRLRVGRTGAEQAVVESLVATADRGDALFGGFRLSWEPAPAPDKLDRSSWCTWVSGTGWEVRPPRRGDRVTPLGGVGHRPLRRLLMEARVPRGRRATYPVVARGETILWVPGICRSAAELPPPGTRGVRLDVIRGGEP